MEFSQKKVKGILVCTIKGQIKISTQTECKEYCNKLMEENCSIQLYSIYQGKPHEQRGYRNDC